MTEYHNVDLTIAAENGKTEKEIKEDLKDKIERGTYNDTVQELVMISKIEEVEQ